VGTRWIGLVGLGLAAACSPVDSVLGRREPAPFTGALPCVEAAGPDGTVVATVAGTAQLGRLEPTGAGTTVLTWGDAAENRRMLAELGGGADVLMGPTEIGSAESVLSPSVVPVGDRWWVVFQNHRVSGRWLIYQAGLDPSRPSISFRDLQELTGDAPGESLRPLAARGDDGTVAVAYRHNRATALALVSQDRTVTSRDEVELGVPHRRVRRLFPTSAGGWIVFVTQLADPTRYEVERFASDGAHVGPGARAAELAAADLARRADGDGFVVVSAASGQGTATLSLLDADGRAVDRDLGTLTLPGVPAKLALVAADAGYGLAVVTRSGSLAFAWLDAGGVPEASGPVGRAGTAQDIAQPALAWTPEGRFLLAWHEPGADGEGAPGDRVHLASLCPP